MISKSPFYISVKHAYKSFDVHHCYLRDRGYFYSDHPPEMYDPKSEYYTYGGHASYYKGKLKTVDALNPKVINYVYTGHFEWSDFSSYPPELDSVNEWQLVYAEGDVEWWCLHSSNKLKIDYLPLTRKITITAGTGIFVLEGFITIKDEKKTFTAQDMNYIKPRDHAITIEGDAKIWKIIEIC